ncbi:MAG: hypothetical protein ACPW60_10160 [Methylohalobius sp. ZOD2]
MFKKIEYIVCLLIFLIPLAQADNSGFSATDPGAEPTRDPRTRFIYDPVQLTNQNGNDPLSGSPAGPVDSEGKAVDPNRVFDPDELPETRTQVDTAPGTEPRNLGHQDSTFVPGRSHFVDPNVRLTGTTLGVDNVCVKWRNEQIIDENGNRRTVQFCDDFDKRYRTRLTWLGERSPRCQGIPGATFDFDESIPGYQGTITVTDLLDDESGETKRYTLECYGDDGNLYSASYTVGQGATQPDSVTVSIRADRTNLIRGQSTRIRWNSSNAIRCLLNGDSVSLSGSRLIRPNSNVTYVLRCSGLGGSARDSVTIRVSDPPPPPPPSFNVTLNVPSVITNGSGSQVSWSTNLQADSCDLWARRPHSGRPSRFSSAWKSNLPGSGSRSVSSFFPVAPEGLYVFEIECSKSGFDDAFASKQTKFVRKQSSSSGSCPPGTHVVIAFPRNRCEPDDTQPVTVDPPLVNLTGPGSVRPSQSFALDLSVSPSASCTYSASGAISGSGSLGTVNGSQSFGQRAPNVTSPTSVTYRVDCTANGKTGSGTHIVNITPEPELSVSVNVPSQVNAGGSFSASFSVKDRNGSPVVASCSYDVSGAIRRSGSFTSSGRSFPISAPNVTSNSTATFSASCSKSGYKSDSDSDSIRIIAPEPPLTITASQRVIGRNGNRFRIVNWRASVPGSTCRIWDDFITNEPNLNYTGSREIRRPNEGDSDGWIRCTTPQGQFKKIKIF